MRESDDVDSRQRRKNLIDDLFVCVRSSALPLLLLLRLPMRLCCL